MFRYSSSMYYRLCVLYVYSVMWITFSLVFFHLEFEVGVGQVSDLLRPLLVHGQAKVLKQHFESGG